MTGAGKNQNESSSTTKLKAQAGMPCIQEKVFRMMQQEARELPNVVMGTLNIFVR